MRFICSRYAVATAALAYLLAGAVSALHHHEHGLHGTASQERDIHDSFGQDGAEHDHSEPSPAPLADDDCLACRLAAQCAVVSLPLAESGLCPLVVELRSTAPTFFVEPVHSCGLARAPPLA
jgi:hypothetical protein